MDEKALKARKQQLTKDHAKLIEKAQELEAQAVQLRTAADQYAGAISDCDYWLSTLTKESADESNALDTGNIVPFAPEPDGKETN